MQFFNCHIIAKDMLNINVHTYLIVTRIFLEQSLTFQ